MRKVIFIVGAGHSGSTLLELILGSHSEAFALGELSFISRKMDNANGGISICGICSGKCEFWDRKASPSRIRSYFWWGTGENRMRYELHKHYGSFRSNIYEHLFEWTGAKMLVDSSKGLWWIRRQLRPFWFWRETKPVLIYITRDGRAVVNSYLRKYPNRSVASFTKHWVAKTLERERYFQAFSRDRRIRVPYEDLTTDPDQVVGSVCRALGISFETEMLRYWRHNHHIVEGNLGTRLLIYKYREEFDTSLIEHWLDANEKTYQTDPAYYDQVGLAIRLDARWQQELSPEQLEVFDSIAGEVNEQYAFNAKRNVEIA